MRQTLIGEFRQDQKLKKAFWLSMLFLVIVEVMIFRLSFKPIAEVGLARCVWAFVLSSLLPMGIGIRLLLRSMPLIFSRYRLYPDQLEVKAGTSNSIIRFIDLLKVEFKTASISLFKGFILCHESGRKIKILSSMPGSGQILEQIHEQRPGLIIERKYVSYQKSLKFSALAWERLADRSKNYGAIFFKYLLLPPAFAIAVYFLTLLPQVEGYDLVLFDWVLISLILHFSFGFLLNVISEKILNLIYSPTILNADFRKKESTERFVETIFNVLYCALSVAAFFILYTR